MRRSSATASLFVPRTVREMRILFPVRGSLPAETLTRQRPRPSSLIDPKSDFPI